MRLSGQNRALIAPQLVSSMPSGLGDQQMYSGVKYLHASIGYPGRQFAN